jgi:ankyrin repeat protein
MSRLLETGVALGFVGIGGSTALMESAKRGNVDALKLLLNAGADWRTKDAEGRDAGMWAAWSGGLGGVAMLEALSRAGASFDEPDAKGATALMRASARGCVECVEFLARERVDLDARSDDGMTAAIKAVRQGQPKCLEALIAAGCKLDVSDQDGMTASMWAAMTPSPRDAPSKSGMLAALISAGASLDVFDNAGRTALHHAGIMDNEEAMAMLLAGGANPGAELDGLGSTLFAAIKGRSEGCALRLLALVGPGAAGELDRSVEEWRVMAENAKCFSADGVSEAIFSMIEARELRRALAVSSVLGGESSERAPKSGGAKRV